MDTVAILLTGFISIVIINNLVFTKFLGICPYLGVSGRLDMAFGMGMAVTFVVTLSGTLTHAPGGYEVRVFHFGDCGGGAACGDVPSKVLSTVV